MEDGDLRLLKLLVAHWAVAGPEVDCSRQHLANAATAADRLVVDLNVRVNFVILVEPLRINGIRECRTCAIQGSLRRQKRRSGKEQK
jgi:hypothetical protein